MKGRVLRDLVRSGLRVGEGQALADQVLAPVVVHANPPVAVPLAVVQDEKVSRSASIHGLIVGLVARHLYVLAIQEASGHIAQSLREPFQGQLMNIIVVAASMPSEPIHANLQGDLVRGCLANSITSGTSKT